MTRIASVNPTTGAVLKEFAPESKDAVEKKLQRAAIAFPKWRARPIAERARVISALGGILDTEQKSIGALMTLEMGKLHVAAMAEAAKCATACRYYAEHGASILQPERHQDGEEEIFVRYDPLGVVLAVMPWNFPFWQVLRFAAPAILAGNVVVLKHASNVPQCAQAIEQLFARAGAPPGVFQTLLIGSDAIAGLIADDRIAAVTLTGSEGAGAQVAAAAGKAIKPVVLELGGSDAFIVMPSADLDAAIRVGVQARTINNGQSCIAAKRFIVHERIADAFEQGFVAAMAALVIGDPMKPETQLGPLATPQGVKDLERQVSESKRLGAKVVTGGRAIPGPGNFFEPTVITEIPGEAPAYHEELFGPVATIFRVRSLDDAIRQANDSEFGLGASAWTTDHAEAERFAAEIEAGSVFINAMVASDPRYPFGGVKKSGFGRELGEHGLRAFTNIKTVRMTWKSASDQAAHTE